MMEGLLLFALVTPFFFSPFSTYIATFTFFLRDLAFFYFSWSDHILVLPCPPQSLVPSAIPRPCSGYSFSFHVVYIFVFVVKAVCEAFHIGQFFFFFIRCFLLLQFTLKTMGGKGCREIENSGYTRKRDTPKGYHIVHPPKRHHPHIPHSNPTPQHSNTTRTE